MSFLSRKKPDAIRVAKIRIWRRRRRAEAKVKLANGLMATRPNRPDAKHPLRSYET